MRIAVWGPGPPAPTGGLDPTAELLPVLARRHDVVTVVDDPGSADLDLYSIGNTPACIPAYRAALARPGVVVLREWGLHDLVWADASDREDLSHYLREMRRSGGEAGSFVGRQVILGFGGEVLPALFAANDALLEGSLGVVTLNREAGERTRHRFGWLPHLHLPAPLGHQGLEATAARLADFLEEVQGQRPRLLAAIEAERVEGTLAAYLVDEVRRVARDMGLSPRPLGLEPLLSPLVKGA